MRQEKLRKLEKRAADEEAAATDAPLSSLTQQPVTEESYSSEDNLFVDTMTGTPADEPSAPFQDSQVMAEAIELHSVSDNDTSAEDSQRGRSGTSEGASHRPPAQDDLRDFLSKKLDTLASKQDIQIVITDIEGVRHNVTEIQNRVAANTDDIARLKSAVDQISKGDIQRHSPTLPVSGDTPHAGTRLGMGRQTPNFLAGASCEAQEIARRAKYEEALRSIRIWPIMGESRLEAISRISSETRSCKRRPRSTS